MCVSVSVCVCVWCEITLCYIMHSGLTQIRNKCSLGVGLDHSCLFKWALHLINTYATLICVKIFKN